VIRGLDGERILDMNEFHRGPYRTAVQDDELLVEIRIAPGKRPGSAYEKLDRRAGDWAVAASGASIELDGDVIAVAGLALAAVGAPVRSHDAEVRLRGAEPTDDVLAAAAASAAAACSPVTDQRGSAEYKRHLAGVLTLRALRRAVARAAGDGA
jgi:aerobic carbon-monoxide dehydrogenase medium subunit